MVEGEFVKCYFIPKAVIFIPKMDVFHLEKHFLEPK